LQTKHVNILSKIEFLRAAKRKHLIKYHNTLFLLYKNAVRQLTLLVLLGVVTTLIIFIDMAKLQIWRANRYTQYIGKVSKYQVFPTRRIDAIDK